MNDAPTADPFRTTGWYKSSYSAADNECVEVSCISAWVGIRDSKASTQNRLIVSADAFGIFVSSVKDGSREGSGLSGEGGGTGERRGVLPLRSGGLIQQPVMRGGRAARTRPPRSSHAR
jgi:hypothetical protein